MPISEETILTLIQHNLGLRLTSSKSEPITGAYGDAVPLSNLACAEDIILFITLSCYLIDNPNAEDIRKQLQDIYHRYTCYKFDHDPKRKSLRYVPELISTYAKILTIGDSENIEVTPVQLPENEEKYLLKIYTLFGGSLFPALLFNKDGQYYNELPFLRGKLIDNFNKLLDERLAINYTHYTHSNTMYYEILQCKSEHYSHCYDMDRYPLGKAGKASFEGTDVLARIEFSTIVSLEYHMKLINQWLHSILQNVTSLTTLSETSQQDKDISFTTQAEPAFLDRCTQFCSNNKSTLILTAIGLFATVNLFAMISPKEESTYQPR